MRAKHKTFRPPSQLKSQREIHPRASFRPDGAGAIRANVGAGGTAQVVGFGPERGGRKSSILLVRPLGFEPKTLCLEGVCSINCINIHIVLDFIGNQA